MRVVEFFQMAVWMHPQAVLEGATRTHIEFVVPEVA
jgi:hypothetical protein